MAELDDQTKATLVEQVLRGGGRYFGSWSKHEDVASSFEEDKNTSFPGPGQILFASYGGQSYEGDALVVFVEGDKLYEVNGGHCSCNGLEGQWSPEETTWEALAMNDGRLRGLIDNEHEADAVQAWRELIATHAGK